MAIKITVDGKTYDGIDAITVGGKVLTLAYVEDSTGGDSGGSGVTTYTIKNNLTNCSNSNKATSITEKTSYTGVITAKDGYELESVSVTMGGNAVAVTNGVISISSVTGNIVITATAKEISVSGDVLPTNGLQAYFDFRTASYNNSAGSGITTIDATQGDGHLFAWATGGVGTQDEYGIHFANGRSHMYSKNKNTTGTDVGNQMTMIMLTYGHVMVQGFNLENVGAKWAFRPKYKFSNGNESAAEQRSSGEFNSDKCDDYNFCVYRVDGNILTEIMDTSVTTYDGTEIQDFASWITTAGVTATNATNDGVYCTAAAIYNRALSNVEIEEARAFFKTLEVVS